MPERFITRTTEDVLTGRTREVKADPAEAGEGKLSTLYPTTIIALRELEKNDKLQWVKVAQIRLPNERLVFTIETDRDDPEMEIDQDAIYSTTRSKVRPPEEGEDIDFMTEVVGTEKEGIDRKIRREDLESSLIRTHYNALKDELLDRKADAAED